MNNDDWYGVTTNASGQVTRLNLANNRLNGTLPTALEDLTNLTALSLNNNQLSGAIPAALGSLSSLTPILGGLQSSRALTLRAVSPAIIIGELNFLQICQN